jgi:hypothetical protein
MTNAVNLANLIRSPTGSTTDAILQLPVGTTAQRPVSSTSTGVMRYNTTLGATEFYGATGWNRVAVQSTDPFIANVVLNMTGGNLIDYTGRHTFSNVNVGSPVATPGKPFPAAESNSWYLINSGTNNYIDVLGNISDFSPMSYTTYTIEFWLYKTGTGSGYGHFFNIGGQNAQGVIKFAADASYGLYWFSSNGEMINFGTAGTFSPNTWTHFVYEKNGSTMTTWRNGTRIAQNTNSLPGSAAYLRLGGPFGSEFSSHYFDELRVTTAARYQGAATIPVQTASWPRS